MLFFQLISDVKIWVDSADTALQVIASWFLPLHELIHLPKPKWFWNSENITNTQNIGTNCAGHAPQNTFLCLGVAMSSELQTYTNMWTPWYQPWQSTHTAIGWDLFHELQHENVEWSIAHTRLTPSISETKTNTYIYIYIDALGRITIFWAGKNVSKNEFRK